MINFTYDPHKASTNLRIHGISFEESATTFFDWNAISEPDIAHSEPGDERFINLGISSKGRLLFVVHNEQEDLIRIISARLASPAQRKRYEES